MAIRYAYIDGDTAVMFNDDEAWQCVNDAIWKPLDHADAFHKAKLLNEAEFRKMFGQLPELPAGAFQSTDKAS